MADSPRQEYQKRLAALRNERSTWVDVWREIADYVKPRTFRYLPNMTNKGWRRDQSIINNTASQALDIAAAGMMAGMTSPSKPWFNLGLHDADLAENDAVREYLDILTDVVRKMLAGSNVYRGLHKTYESLLLHGTACLYVEEDPQQRVRAFDFPIGQYCLANSSRLQVDTVFREYKMTPRQMVQYFGLDALSDRVKTIHKNSSVKEEWIDVVFVVEPNPDHRDGALGPRGKPWLSTWFEAGQDDLNKKLLRQSGYYEMPVMAPRWNVTGEDVYGDSPGMSSIGDIRALQELEREKGRVVEKIVDPPMQGPSSMMNQQASILPGEMNYVDNVGAGNVFKPAMEILPTAIPAVEGSIREHEQRIRAAFFADVWMMMSQEQDTPRQTAREVAEKHEEKMMRLGPVLESLTRELHGPLVERCVGIAQRTPGLLPIPPKELQGQELSIEYVSIVAQAQKMLGIAGIERVSTFVGSWAEQKPEILDKINIDAFIDEYAADIGIKSNLLVPDDVAQKVRAARAQAQQQQLQAQQALAMAQGAKTLSQTDTSGDNGLTRLLNGMPAAATGQ